jgi:hypothetical protein
MTNVIFVSEPDVYFADQKSVLFVGDSKHTDFVVDLLSKSKKPYTVYWATQHSSIEWVANVGSVADYIVLDCKINDFFTGFFIDKHNTFYYNNVTNMNMINVNKINDVSDAVIKLLATED